jgi:hypothetical protein
VENELVAARGFGQSIESVVFRGFRGTLRVIFRLKESNTGLDRYYSRLKGLNIWIKGFNLV